MLSPELSIPKEESEIFISPADLDAICTVFSDFFKLGNASFELIFQNPEEIRILNKEHRQIDKSTDVLSFPTFNSLEEILTLNFGDVTPIGTVIICPEKCEEYNESIPQLVHHGILHLLGFDHESNFERWQNTEVSLVELLARANVLIPKVENV